MEAVSLTAQWTAAVRAVETRRGEDRLFADELAHSLAEPDGYRLLDRYKGGGLTDFIAIRTKFFDLAISNALRAAEIRQVVIVAAGMDTRAYRLLWPDGVRLYEVDHEALLSEKTRRLAALGASSRVARVGVAADLSRPWRRRLIEAGFDLLAPTLWVAEGLVFYLEPHQAADLLTELGELSPAGSSLLVDMPSEALLRSPICRKFLEALRADGVPWRFGSDAPEAFLNAAGWACLEIKQPGEDGAAFGRWPYTPPPRVAPGYPRSWLIKAGKRVATSTERR